MSSASGIVEVVNSRPTKVGTTWSFALSGQEGWYGTFKDTPPAKGDYVEFDFKVNGAGFQNVDMKTLVNSGPAEEEEPSAGNAGTPPAKPTSGKAVAVAKASNKDANIQWQSARNAAIQLTLVAANAGVLDLGTGKKDGKLEALGIYVNRLTLDFFDQSMEVSATGDAPEDFRG